MLKARPNSAGTSKGIAEFLQVRPPNYLTLIKESKLIDEAVIS